MKKVSGISQSNSGNTRKILCLGYEVEQTAAFRELLNREFDVWHCNDAVSSFEGFHLVVSFGYRKILPKQVLRESLCPVINLHISYLPFNRGAHPNFWSFYDGTPSGVTIHLIDEGIDTGQIMYQKHVEFDAREDTFRRTHQRLVEEIENLFLENIDEILNLEFPLTPQRGKGSVHNLANLPEDFRGWDCLIDQEIARLKAVSPPD